MPSLGADVDLVPSGLRERMAEPRSVHGHESRSVIPEVVKVDPVEVLLRSPERPRAQERLRLDRPAEEASVRWVRAVLGPSERIDLDETVLDPDRAGDLAGPIDLVPGVCGPGERDREDPACERLVGDARDQPRVDPPRERDQRGTARPHAREQGLGTSRGVVRHGGVRAPCTRGKP